MQHSGAIHVGLQLAMYELPSEMEEELRHEELGESKMKLWWHRVLEADFARTDMGRLTQQI